MSVADIVMVLEELPLSVYDPYTKRVAQKCISGPVIKIIGIQSLKVST